ncbi:MAG: hypothetical protein ACT4O6_06020 [Reyranella sp.]
MDELQDALDDRRRAEDEESEGDGGNARLLKIGRPVPGGPRSILVPAGSQRAGIGRSIISQAITVPPARTTSPSTTMSAPPQRSSFAVCWRRTRKIEKSNTSGGSHTAALSSAPARHVQ